MEKKYLKYIVEQIHSTVVATVDENGLPVTCVIDMMDYDEDGLYFLTAKGKRFYDRLKARGLSFTDRDERAGYPALRFRIVWRKGAGNRAGQAGTAVSEEPVYERNLSYGCFQNGADGIPDI